MPPTCRHRLPAHLAPDRARCGQHLHITGARGGLCIVLELSAREFGQLSSKDYLPRTVYLELGLLRPDPLMAEVRNGAKENGRGA